MHEDWKRRDFLFGGAAAGIWQAAAGAQSLVLPNGPSVLDWGIKSDGAVDSSSLLQRALDETPIGSALYFPPGDYRVERPLRLRRQLQLIGHGARIRGKFPRGSTENLLTINVEDPINRDNRNQRIQGLLMSLEGGTGNTLAITNNAPNVANIGMIIEGNILIGPAGGAGRALHLEGLGTHHLTVRNNQIENGIHVNTADGVTISDCLIFGEKTGITLDMIPGAFATRILRNAIVARDGALVVRNGSQIYFEHNTIEQFPQYGRNQTPKRAHVTIAPTDYGARHVHLVGNNFGGSDNADVSIYVTGDCQDLYFDRNVFQVNARDTDVILDTPSVGWTRIGPNNTVRGPSARRPHLARGEALAIQDRGTGTFGARRRDALIGLNGWRLDGEAAVFKTLDGVLRLEGKVSGLQGAGGMAIARLSPGYRPMTAVLCLSLTEEGGMVPLRLETDGTIRLVKPWAGSLQLSMVTCAAEMRPAYPAQDP